MSKKVLPASLCATFIATSFILLTGCSASGGQGAPKNETQSTSDAGKGNSHAKSEAACQDNLLVKALPPKDAINGYPFEFMDCTFNTARAIYGTKHGKEVEVTLSDTRSPGITSQPEAVRGFYTSMGESMRQATKLTVDGSIATRKGMEEQPILLPPIGGPDYLPVIETAPSGEPLVVQVGAKGSGTPAVVAALLKDRYVVNIEARDGMASVSELSGPQAQAFYDPFLKQMHLELLP